MSGICGTRGADAGLIVKRGLVGEGSGRMEGRCRWLNQQWAWPSMRRHWPWPSATVTTRTRAQACMHARAHILRHTCTPTAVGPPGATLPPHQPHHLHPAHTHTRGRAGNWKREALTVRACRPRNQMVSRTASRLSSGPGGDQGRGAGGLVRNAHACTHTHAGRALASARAPPPTRTRAAARVVCRPDTSHPRAFMGPHGGARPLTPARTTTPGS